MATIEQVVARIQAEGRHGLADAVTEAVASLREELEATRAELRGLKATKAAPPASVDAVLEEKPPAKKLGAGLFKR